MHRIGKPSSIFTRFSKYASHAMGHPVAFIAALCVIVLWSVAGPLVGFSDTWQLVINTGTTIITFLMVFLIQNTQNRDTAAIQLKLDELIRVIEKADNSLLNLEELEEKDLERIRSDYEKLAEDSRSGLPDGCDSGPAADEDVR